MLNQVKCIVRILGALQLNNKVFASVFVNVHTYRERAREGEREN